MKLIISDDTPEINLTITDNNEVIELTVSEQIDDIHLEIREGSAGVDGKDGYTPQKGIDYFDGEKGDDGSSAYQIAVLNGFVGTESEWLASLKGEKGQDADPIVVETKAETDASNISEVNAELWRNKLNVPQIPETGSNGDVLEKDSTEEGGVKWSNRLTNVENELDTEIVNRIAADANLQATKQDNLISGVNIKTVNNRSILGSGDISIDKKNVQVATVQNLDASYSTVQNMYGFPATFSGNANVVNTSGGTNIDTKNIAVGAVVTNATTGIAGGTKVLNITGQGSLNFAPFPQTNITSISSTGSAVTFNFAEKQYVPFAAGASIVISGVEPSDYNGTFVVTACTTTSVTINSTVTTAVTLTGFIDFTFKTGIVSVNIDNKISALNIDGIALNDDDRILLKDQNKLNNYNVGAADNGIWKVVNKGSETIPWELVRDVDGNTSELLAESIVLVGAGNINTGRTFTTDFRSTDVLRTSPVNWMFTNIIVGNGYVPRSTGNSLVNGSIQDNGTTIGIGGAPTTAGTQPAKVTIYPNNSNGKILNIPTNGGWSNGDNTNPQHGDIFVAKQNIWVRPPFGNRGDRRDGFAMKLLGVDCDFVGRYRTPVNLNIFTPSTHNSTALRGNAELIFTGSQYGLPLTSEGNGIGGDPRMYDGMMLSAGTEAHGNQADLFCDYTGRIFARGRGYITQTDWKAALMDMQYRTTTLGWSGAGINPDIPSAKFAIESTTRGFLLPRMTKAQRNAIPSPVAGLMIYQTDSGNDGLRIYNGTNWLAPQTVTD